jgi:hypothetical protein
MSEQPKLSGELAAIRRNLPSKPYPAPRGEVLYQGTPEYAASLEARAPQIAANEAARIAREAQREADIVVNNGRRAELRLELDRIKAELKKWDEEHEPHYQTMEAARVKAKKKNEAFTRALNAYNAGKIRDSALLRSALAHQATADAYNALLPAYNARIEDNRQLWKARLETEQLLYSIKP